ncbi:MAG: TolC family protein [Planctomycetota bacterium]
MGRIISIAFACLLAGCAGYSPDAGWQEPRPLGRDYASYRPASSQAAEKPTKAPSETKPPADPKSPLSLRHALALALLRNPELAAFSWDIRAAEARRLQASLLPNPEIGTEVEEFTGNRTGFSQSETTVTLSQLVLLGGKRVKQMRLAGLERDLAGWDYESKRLDVFTDVVRFFVRVLGAQRQIALTEETVHIAEGVARAASDRVKAGAAAPVEETRAKVALSSARIELERAQQELVAARKRLAATWGGGDAEFTETVGELEIRLTPPPLRDLMMRISQNPDLARWVVEMDRRLAAVEVEKAKAVPDITVEAGYRHLADDDVDTFVAGFSLPLPVFDRNQGGVAESRANLAKAKEENRAAEVRIATELAEAHASLSAAAKEVDLLETEVLPGAKSAFEAIEEGYRKGKFTNLDLLEAQKTLAEAKSQHVRALVSLHEAKANVERLIGEPLPATKSRP